MSRLVHLLHKVSQALVAALCVTGCSDLGEPIHLSAHAEVSASALDFGTVAVSASATRSVIVSNSGGGRSPRLGERVVPRLLDPEWRRRVHRAAGRPAHGGRGLLAECHGTSECQLDLGPDIPPVSLTGAGALQAPGAQCVLSVTTLDFGTAAVGGSRQDGFTISNPGTAALDPERGPHLRRLHRGHGRRALHARARRDAAGGRPVRAPGGRPDLVLDRRRPGVSGGDGERLRDERVVLERPEAPILAVTAARAATSSSHSRQARS